MKPRPLRWGILGTGMIARKFAEQLPASSSGRLCAVGSRSADSAAAFAAACGGRPFGSYEEVLADAEVDAIYVALPNAMHGPWTLRALEQGKHVLCEKPLASDFSEAQRMFNAARKRDRLLVEAFMYRCHPGLCKALALVRAGALGEIRLIQSQFTFSRPPRGEDHRYQPDQAGGALMDVGCYCVNFARAAAGAEPDALFAAARLHPGGVDEYAAGVLGFGGKIFCGFVCGMTVPFSTAALIAGTEGRILLSNPWLAPQEFLLERGEHRETVRCESPQGLYALEADAFAAAVAGQAPPWISTEDSLGNMKALDALRRSAGVTIPQSR